MSNLSTDPRFTDSLMNQYGFNPIGKTQSRDKRMLIYSQAHKHLLETIESIDYKDSLPKKLTKDLIERIIYFRGKGAIFKFQDNVFFLPFTLNGTIDVYGRYEYITPTLFTGKWDEKSKKWNDNYFLPSAVSNIKFKVMYSKEDVCGEGELPAVILTDSSLEISQDLIPMNAMISPYIEQMVDILVLVNIDLVTSAKVFYIVAKDNSQKAAIENEFNNLDTKILNGKRVVVLTSDLELKELQGEKAAKDTARYFQSFQSIDNLRKAIIGIDNGGTFLKQEHQTDQETQSNSSGGALVLKNRIRQRKEWADIANHHLGLNITVDAMEVEEKNAIEPEGKHTKQQRGDE